MAHVFPGGVPTSPQDFLAGSVLQPTPLLLSPEAFLGPSTMGKLASTELHSMFCGTVCHFPENRGHRLAGHIFPMGKFCSAHDEN